MNPQYPTSSLQPGMKGDAVSQLQKYLMSSGYDIPALKSGTAQYGFYGPQTQSAVTALQSKLGVQNAGGVGYYGPKTLAALQGQNQNPTSYVNPNAPNAVGAQGVGGAVNNPSNLPDVNPNPPHPITGVQGGGEPDAPTIFGAPKPPTPPAPPKPTDFLQNYLDTLKPTANETDLQNQLINIQAQGQAQNTALGNQAIPMPFITGQQKSLREDYENKQQTVTQRLALEQSKRQSSIDVNKATLDYNTNKENAKATAQSNRYQNIGGQAFDTTTGQYVGGGTGGTTSTNVTTTPAGLASGKTLSSGNLKYTAPDYSADKKALIASRGSDGWVNPAIYVKLYKAWIAGGGVKSDFLKVYPLKDYVNPANIWPEILDLRHNTSTSTSGGLY